jgi:hypothetical protein
MVKVIQLSWLALVMAASAVLIIFASNPFLHISRFSVIVVIASVLLCAAFVQTRSYFHFRPTPRAMRWIVLGGSLLFLCGALHGVFQSLREGWRWSDLYFVLPTVLGFYFLWITFRIWRR